MKPLLPAAYPHEVGPRESLAHSIDYVDPQVGPFTMTERAHNPVAPSPSRHAVKLFARDPDISVDHRRLRIETGSFLSDRWVTALFYIAILVESGVSLL